MSYSHTHTRTPPRFGPWVSVEIPARSGPPVPVGKAPGVLKQGLSPGFSPNPARAREGTGADPTAFTPKTVPPAPLQPLVPSTLFHPGPQYLSPCHRAPWFLCSQRKQHSHSRVGRRDEQPLFPVGSAGEARTRQGAGPWCDPASCTVQGSVEQAKGLLVTTVTSHRRVMSQALPRNVVTKGDGASRWLGHSHPPTL